jgi:ribosome-binding protein aMBF1 (putative translation factor)
MIDAEPSALQAKIEEASRVCRRCRAQLRSVGSRPGKAARTHDGGRSRQNVKRRIIEALVEKIKPDTVEKWVVQQTELTIVYRFSQPNEPAPLVLPRSVRVSSRNRIPRSWRRSATTFSGGACPLGCFRNRSRNSSAQSCLRCAVGKRIGSSRRSSSCRQSSGSSATIPCRRAGPGRSDLSTAAHGLSQKQAARRMGVDLATLARWERGERKPTGSFEARVTRFLDSVDHTRTTTRIA